MTVLSGPQKILLGSITTTSEEEDDNSRHHSMSTTDTMIRGISSD